MFLSPQRELSVRRRNRLRPFLEALEARDTPSGAAPTVYDFSPTVNHRGDANMNLYDHVNDPENDPVTVTIVTQPTHGSLALVNGDYVYTPDDISYTGSDSFTYKASDGTSFSNTATVSITVANTAPVLDAETPPQDQTVFGTMELSFAVGAYDADYDDLTYSMTGAPSWLSMDPQTGAITGTVPDDVDDGSFTITYKAFDGAAYSAPQSFVMQAVAFRVTSVAISAPQGDITVTPEGVSVSVTISGVGAPPASQSQVIYWAVIATTASGGQTTLQAQSQPIYIQSTQENGAWSITRNFTLYDSNGSVAGATGSSGQYSPQVMVSVQNYRGMRIGLSAGVTVYAGE